MNLDVLGDIISATLDQLNATYPGLSWILLSGFAALLFLSAASGIRCGITTQRGTPCTKGRFGGTCHHHRRFGTFGPNAGRAGVRGALAAAAAAPAGVLGIAPLL